MALKTINNNNHRIKWRSKRVTAAAGEYYCTPRDTCSSRQSPAQIWDRGVFFSLLPPQQCTERRWWWSWANRHRRVQLYGLDHSHYWKAVVAAGWEIKKSSRVHHIKPLSIGQVFAISWLDFDREGGPREQSPSEFAEGLVKLLE